MNDPFKNFKPLNNSTPQSKKSSNAPQGDSFVEQIKGIGSSAVSSFKTDVVKGTAQSIFDQILGSAKTGNAPEEKGNKDEFFKEWIADRESKAAEEAKLKERAFQQRAREHDKVLFSFTDEKMRQEINAVRQEIEMLVKTMGKVEDQIEQAVIQEVVDPGVYHLNFFRKLRGWIVMMRKSLEDASLWMQTTSGRNKGKGYYWQQFGASGTKYSMSSERNVQMGAG
jgi:hypothetical protein